MRRAGFLTLIACAATALIAPAGVSAAVQCGDILAQDTKLKKDLDCSGFAGSALVIGADGITLDLNGHEVKGPPDDQAGIDLMSGYKNVTVKDGTLDGFYQAVSFLNNKNLELSHLQIKLRKTNDYYGIYGGVAAHVDMSHVHVDNSAYGVYVYDSVDVVLRHAKITGNDPVITDGVYVGSNAGPWTGTFDDVQANHAYIGLYLYGKSDGVKVTDSVANRNENSGFSFANALDPHEYRASGNVANDNGQYGYFAEKKVAGSGNRGHGNGVDDCVKVSCG